MVPHIAPLLIWGSMTGFPSIQQYWLNLPSLLSFSRPLQHERKRTPPRRKSNKTARDIRSHCQSMRTARRLELREAGRSP